MSLTRADLEQDRIREELAQTPLGPHLLSAAELEESLWQILEASEAGEPCWVFGYGSLVWNPLFPYEEKRVVTAYGYHRSFCLWSRINRGTLDRPGLVLGLDRGGRCCTSLPHCPGSRRRTAPHLAARNDARRLRAALGAGERQRRPVPRHHLHHQPRRPVLRRTPAAGNHH
jgi:hypothetical protein